MSERIPVTRLDQILLAEGLVNEEQIREALVSQKTHGGRLGSQLIHLGHIDEAGLVRALAIQHGCEGVLLSELEIPDIIIRFVPTRIAISRKVMPFDYNPDENVLKIACEDPSDPSLVHEMNFVGRGKKVRLYVAAELALINAIAKYYMDFDPAREGGPLIELPPVDESLLKPKKKPKEPPPESYEPFLRVLLITDTVVSAEHFRQLLPREVYSLEIAESITMADELVENTRFDFVLVNRHAAGDEDLFVDRLRRISMSTRVRFFDSPADLLLNEHATPREINAAVRNLDLFSLLIESLVDRSPAGGGKASRYVDKLCRRLKLSDRERLLITNAAYLRDLAGQFYDIGSSALDRKKAIGLTVRMLESLEFPKVVIDILRMTYSQIGENHRLLLPLPVLGANIITVVDYFFESQPLAEPLSLDKLEAAKRAYTQHIGRLFLDDVVEAFFDMMQDEVLSPVSNDRFNQVLILGPESDGCSALLEQLRAHRFRTVAVYDIDSFVELYRRSLPDMVVLYAPGKQSEVSEVFDALVANSVTLEHTPAFLVASEELYAEPQQFLERGVIDVLPINDRLNLLIARLRQAQRLAEAKGSAVVPSEEPDPEKVPQ